MAGCTSCSKRHMQVLACHLLAPLAHASLVCLPCAVSPGVFALAAYALLYSLPSQVSCVLVIAGALAVHTALSGIAVASFSGRALAFALPAALVVSAVIILAFLAGATVKSYVCPSGWWISHQGPCTTSRVATAAALSTLV